MSVYKLEMDQYAALARKTAAEGCVLLKNENSALPLKKGDKVAVYGRIASTYYKSGLGSGGMVNTKYVVGILDALENEKDITIVKKVRELYDSWISENPFDEGKGWGQVPWSQKEMPVSEELLKAGDGCDVAMIIIGRTAGEDQDNKEEEGSYLLTADEKELLKAVCGRFSRTVVVLNVGNIIDMKWVDEYKPSAVLYAWQGGQEGGNGVADVLMGRVNPCGKLTDTIAKDIADYPSTANFGDKKSNTYMEDIYVGYRYFETFAKDKVLYPFGFGLSYTTFEQAASLTDCGKEDLTVEVQIKNTGDAAGKEVAQVYIEAPQGKLGKPARVLAGFAKTGVLKPGETQTLSITVPKSYFASFDDSGVTGHRNAFVLEEGTYRVYAGADVRSAVCCGEFEQKFEITTQCNEACAPVEAFERMKPSVNADGSFSVAMESAPLRSEEAKNRVKGEGLKDIPYTGNKGFKLADVYNKKTDMDTFVAQLTDDELIYLHRGEGMCSMKVTPGTAAAFGGLTEGLKEYGIPAMCASDGPSGIRMDCGTAAFSLPNGAVLGSTFDVELVQALYEMTSRELRQNKIDTLLGPGMNIHRNPLNGRNFEYYSEDPLVTGKIASAQLKGLHAYGASGTIKHFATNNQETNRYEVNAVVSGRALREIYLKGFELAVKEGNCRSVMTTYGPLNGIWTAGNYDLNTVILREEWGFEGIVMTDWWSMANDEGEPGSKTNRAPMLTAQNDLIMVTPDATDHNQDNITTAFEAGRLTRAELARNVKNILGFALSSIAIQYEMNLISDEELSERRSVAEAEDFIPDDIVYFDVDPVTNEAVIDASGWEIKKGMKQVVGVNSKVPGFYDITIEAASDLDDLAQLPVTIYMDNTIKANISFRGSNGKWETEKRDISFVFPSNHYLGVYFGANGLKVKTIKISLREEVKLG